MVRRKIMGLFVCTLILGMASFALAFVPDLGTSSASSAYHEGGGVETVSIFVLPNGGGISFANAYLPSGATVDATVTLFVRDASGTAIDNFPAEDMWLASAGMAACTGGAIADFSTNINGETRWANPLNAGGSTTAGSLTQVIISGDALTSSAGMAMRFNSADINADGDVNLSDVGNFSTDFFGAYNYRSDFVHNGNLDLADVGKMAVGIGASCP